MQFSTATSLPTLVLLPSALTTTTVRAWTINAYGCSDCGDCAPTFISGQGSAACTAFGFSLSSVSSVAELDHCTVHYYLGLDGCRTGTGEQTGRDGQCVPEGGSSNNYFSVTCL